MRLVFYIAVIAAGVAAVCCKQNTNVCKDKLTNCSYYSNVCSTKGPLVTWVQMYCPRYCNLCHLLYTTTAAPSTSPGDQHSTYDNMHDSYCYYDGKEYTQGETWQDGCRYNCTCVSGTKGYYTCIPACPNLITPTQIPNNCFYKQYGCCKKLVCRVPNSGRCLQQAADIVFLLDSSGSVGSTNFKKQLDFVAQFVNTLNIGPTAVQVGVTTFASKPTHRFWMNQYQNKADLLTAIHAIPYSSGGTHTDQGLTFVMKNDFTAANGDRDNVPNILIVMTDGRSQVPVQTKNVANMIKTQTNWSVFTIGIGLSVSQAELNEIATIPRNAFTVSNFNTLKNIQSTLQATICENKPKKDLCMHNGKTYTNGPTWQDKCENICQCLDTIATNCTQECPQLGSLPSQCQLIQDSKNLCCYVLSCSSPLFG